MANTLLLEAIADIAFIAGNEGYYNGNSRADIDDFISWALEFEEIHKGENWYEQDYIDVIYEFTYNKMNGHNFRNTEYSINDGKQNTINITMQVSQQILVILGK